jgi:hypothetical protein
MNLLSRSCVSAVFAFGALACSDPVPPAAQGAFIANVKSGVPNRMCPSGTSLTFDVPHEDPIMDAALILDQDTYVEHVTDGQDGSLVRCSVRGSSTFTFDGRIQSGLHDSVGQALEISGGTLGENKKGTARITLQKPSNPGFSSALSAPPSSLCVIDAAPTASNAFQVKAGSLWAHYSCPMIIAEPSDGCAADGYFVLENCVQ